MKLIALLSLLGTVTIFASPFRLSDLETKSPWIAHIDAAKLRTSPLQSFLAETGGFDQFLELKASLKEKLSLDLEAIEGVTLLGSGNQWKETSILVRGDFQSNDFNSLPTAGDSAIHRGPTLGKKPLFLTKHSERELVVGTSVQAVRDGLDTLAKPAIQSWGNSDLTDHIRSKLSSTTALFAIDMKTIGKELKFEAELTRAMRSAWFLIGSRGNDIEVTFLINSSDSEGLTFLSERWTLFSTMLVSGKETPQGVRESMAAQKVEMHKQWMTITMTAPPKKAAGFLDALGSLFAEKPGEIATPR